MYFRTYITVLTTLLGLNTSALFSEDRYYMAIFGSQTEPNIPRASHTYAVFARVPDTAANPKEPELETFCISWLPRTLSIETLRRFPEPGINLSLSETNRWAHSVGASITMWGPYRVQKDFYHMAQQQYQRLTQNGIGYICLDRGLRGRSASNCIHAVSDLDVTQPMLQTGTARGAGASAMVVQHFQKHVVPVAEDTTWLNSKLGLNPAEIRFATAQTRTPPPPEFGYRDFWQGIAWPVASQ